MKRPSREEYQRAVALAREAIRETKDAPRIRADRSPQAVLANMMAKAEKGGTVTEADLGAMNAALAEQEIGKRRGRGRPKGTRADGYWAMRAAIWGAGKSGLQPYRNNTGPRLSQCDAIAEAMQAEGFRTLCSYDAAKREMVALRKSLRSDKVPFAPRLQAIQRDLAKTFEQLGRQMQKSVRTANASFEPIARQLEGVTERIRAQVALPPKTLRAIERAMKTRR